MDTPTQPTPWSNAQLDRMQYEADPLADATVAALLGPWDTLDAAASADALLAANHARWQRLAAVSRLFGQWKDNQALRGWQAPPGTPPEVAAPVEAYLRAAPGLPDWAEPRHIARAEALFMDHGVLSCTLLFCASLPECYVIPDLSQALLVTGQLQHHTEYRIRATAAMIFPVMMDGGLTQPHGGGIAQVLKVRLIHATIRNLILRGSPEQTLARLDGRFKVAGAAALAPLPALQGSQDMHRALFAHGWNVGRDGLPINQEEMAYTLLTFGYVYLRGMRKLGLALSPDDEIATLHTWNVVGHVLGIRPELMAHTMQDAERLFALTQARGRADPFAPDPRPELGRALMQTMEDVIPLAVAKPIPKLMTRHLCGRRTARDIGLDGQVPWYGRLAFFVLLWGVRFVDAVVRLVLREFSVVRFVTRVFGRRFMAQVLMDQTRPLKLPQHVIGPAQALMQGWQQDPKAPKWLNALEQRLVPPPVTQ